ncbi:hypothetical protein [Thalassotalea sp. PLHSN55]|uniref:hypothetical protein n=1 Tax=Thalassotalea sp. PLHSN55 TaxID=3435888 RepID=UPI003F868F7D
MTALLTQEPVWTEEQLGFVTYVSYKLIAAAQLGMIVTCCERETDGRFNSFLDNSVLVTLLI